MTSTVPTPQDRATLTVDEAAELLGISRGTAYASVADGTIPAVRFGTRIVVPTAGLRRLLGLDPDGR